MTSLATVVSLTVFSVGTRLGLHHTIVASTLLIISTFPTHVLESWKVDAPELFIAQQFRLAILSASSWWIMLEMPCLGSFPQCNQCVLSSYFGHAYHVSDKAVRSWWLTTVLWVSYWWCRDFLWHFGPYFYMSAIPAAFSGSWKKDWLAYLDKTATTNSTYFKRMPTKGKVVVWALAMSSWYYDNSTVRQMVLSTRDPLRYSPSEWWFRRAWDDVKLVIRVPRCHRGLFALAFTIVRMIDVEKSCPSTWRDLKAMIGATVKSLPLWQRFRQWWVRSKSYQDSEESGCTLKLSWKIGVMHQERNKACSGGYKIFYILHQIYRF